MAAEVEGPGSSPMKSVEIQEWPDIPASPTKQQQQNDVEKWGEGGQEKPLID